jgi:tetratricopeptide (TPR) repeat protein
MSHVRQPGGTVRDTIARAHLVLSIALGLACGASSTPPNARPAMPDPLADVEAEELYAHGAALAQQGDSMRAEQYIVAAVERGFPVDEALPLLIQVCVASDRLSSALSHAEPHLRQHPDRWPLRHVVGTLYLGLGRVDDAQRELERVVDQAPNAAMPHFHLGMLLYENRGDREAARPHLERYLELDPDGRHVAEARSVLTSRDVRCIERIEPVDAVDGGPTPPAPTVEPPPRPSAGDPARGPITELRPSPAPEEVP